MNLQQIKQRFGVIGDSPKLNRALEVAMQVAPTDMTVLITGESGTGKEIMPQIIHQLSKRKHGKYIAVNCGAIPEGTIDSELFGHEKGAFTGAQGAREGYFEVADGGTIFLDEVAELPVNTQVRLLRVLETGEFIRVGSSKNRKTDVRIIAASNIDLNEAIKKEKFRQDLYYRLNIVPIHMPPLRERDSDIHLLFRKFSSDLSDKYHMPKLKLTEEAVKTLKEYRWPGNVRQLKNITEQMAIIERDRHIDNETLKKYLPENHINKLPVLTNEKEEDEKGYSERELLYKVLFDMKKDISDLKKLVVDIIQGSEGIDHHKSNEDLVHKFSQDIENANVNEDKTYDASSENKPLELPSSSGYKYEKPKKENIYGHSEEGFQDHEEVEENLSLEDTEKELIKKALLRHKGRRKEAAKDLGISERTLYRKIKEYGI
ncbi:MAG: sigma-54 interaction domain-containing protein [Flavobacteriales bacterium]